MKKEKISIYTNNVNKKDINVKKLKICSHCLYNVKKLISCNSCKDKFCYKCLHEINKNEFLCDDCLLKLVKEKAIFILTKK